MNPSLMKRNAMDSMPSRHSKRKKKKKTKTRDLAYHRQSCWEPKRRTRWIRHPGQAKVGTRTRPGGRNPGPGWRRCCCRCCSRRCLRHCRPHRRLLRSRTRIANEAGLAAAQADGAGSDGEEHGASGAAGFPRGGGGLDGEGETSRWPTTAIGTLHRLLHRHLVHSCRDADHDPAAPPGPDHLRLGRDRWAHLRGSRTSSPREWNDPLQK